jgi:hypothetical protein
VARRRSRPGRPATLERRARLCEGDGMTDTLPDRSLPDRLATDPDSPFYDAEILARNVGVRFKGEDKTNVDEYCVSEGWVKLAVGKTLDRRGKQLTIKLNGPVEPYFRDAD